MQVLAINNKLVDSSSLEFGDFDWQDENPWLERAWFVDGTELTDSELDTLADDFACELHMKYMDQKF